MLFKKGVLENLTIFTGKHLCWSLWRPDGHATLLKMTPTQVFSQDYCKIFSNSLFYRTRPLAASEDEQNIKNNFLEIHYFEHAPAIQSEYLEFIDTVSQQILQFNFG